VSQIIFRNATVLHGNRKPGGRTNVVVQGDRIRSVGEQTPPPQAADKVFDVAGKVLMPGLTTAHWHPDYDRLMLTDLVGVPLGLTKPPAYLIAMAYLNLQNALLSGVTRVIGAGCSFDIDASFQLAIAEGKFAGPRILAAGRHLNTTGSPNDTSRWWNEGGSWRNGLHYDPSDIYCDGPAEFQKAARMEIKRGVQVLKVFTSGGHGVAVPNERRDLSPAELAAVVGAAHDRGVLVRAHCVGKQNILDTVKAGVDIIDHADELDEECIELMAGRGTYWVPSMLLTKVVLDNGGFGGIDLTPIKRDFANVCARLQSADRAGVKIVPGDDYGVALTPHVPGVYARELEMYVKHVGIPALDVICWATVNGASLMRREDDRGVIEQGQIADLLIVDGDPVSDISVLTDPRARIPLIMSGGKIVKNALASHPGK
jgi:imidazolonepropionase-like amidohydrolase